MKSYEATATITADPDRIWAILTDAGAYPDWDSGVAGVDGEIEAGGSFKIFPEGMKRGFPTKVADFRPGEGMTWTGGMPLGLFKGVRTFTLTAEGEATRFEMREQFTGPLLPLIWRSMPDLQPSFDQFANGLKQRAEQQG